MEIDVVVVPINGSLLAFTIFLTCVAKFLQSGKAEETDIRLPNWVDLR